LRGIGADLIELFVGGDEDGLLDTARLCELVPSAPGGWPAVFMLHRAVAPSGAGKAIVAGGTYSLAQLKDACQAKGLPVGGTKAVLRARLGIPT
jgi:hypothetical protein